MLLLKELSGIEMELSLDDKFICKLYNKNRTKKITITLEEDTDDNTYNCEILEKDFDLSHIINDDDVTINFGQDQLHILINEIKKTIQQN